MDLQTKSGGSMSVTDYNKMIRDKAAARRVLNQKVLTKYKERIMNGENEQEVRLNLMAIFPELSERKLQNILDKRGVIANPKAQALTDAKMMVWLEKLECDIDLVRDECDRQLDEIDELEASGEKYYEYEVTEYVGGKGEGITTKKKKLWDARHDIMKRKSDALDRYFTAVRALRGNTTLINIDQRSEFSDMKFSDIQRRIQSMEDLHNLNKEETDGKY